MSWPRAGGLAAAAGALLTAAVVGLAVTGSSGGGRSGRAAPVDDPNEMFFADGAQFTVECDYSHSAPVDPIVLPDQPGRSHRHDFFGSTAVDASSTGASLLGTDTTCGHHRDTASYWAPSLLVDGEPVEPRGLAAYYRVAPGVDPAVVEPHPLGLAVVGGDATATTAQPGNVVGFGCGRGGSVSATVPACDPDAPLNLRVTFPDCWDGERLDAPDHRSHLAYSGVDGCAGDHPVALSRLTLVIDYGLHGVPGDVTLASGPPHTAHADFLNGWEPGALDREVRSCLRRAVVCGIPESSRSVATLGQ